MAASWQDHFHIVDSAEPGNTTTTGEWKGLAPDFKVRVIPRFSIAAAPRRSISGILRPYVLQDDSGPIAFKDWQVLVRCSDWADVETWQGYLGSYKWFIFNYHDAAAHNSYTQKVWVSYADEPEVTGTLATHIMLNVHLADASQT